MQRLRVLSIIATLVLFITMVIGCTGPDDTPVPTLEPTATATSTPSPVPTTTPTPTVTMEPGPALDPVLEEIAGEVTELRELAPLTDINLRFMSPDEFEEWFEGKYLEENPEDEIATLAAVLVTLDMIEPDFDLGGFLLELTKGDVVGVFDYTVKEMIVRGDIEQIGVEEKITFAHEYVHGLQHEYFDVESLLLETEDGSDPSMAALSLIEGDAMLVALLYAMQYLDISEWDGPEPGDDDLLESAPLVISASYLFPYIVGMEFVGQLFLQGGWDAVNRAYVNPPRSTEQVIHPDKYLSQDEPQELMMPDLKAALGEEWSQLYTDTLGELDIQIYLKAFVDDATAAAAAEGWGGDRYVFWEDTNQRRLLVLQSVWDTDKDAEEFFSAYTDFIHNKSLGDWDVLLDDQGKRWWSDQGLSVYLSKSGDDVLLIIAPDTITVEAVMPYFEGF